MPMNKREFFLLVLILIGAFVVRLYGFQNPIADWHAWRQADTSAVSRNFAQQGFDLLHPRFDDLSNVPSGKDNPNGYRFVEFPIYNTLQAGFFLLFGYFTLEEWGRLVTIFSSLLTIVFIYGIVFRRAGKKAALLGALFFSFLPYNIYYGRTILPDTSMAMAITGAIYFFDLFLNDKNRGIYFLLTVLFASAAFLLKPFSLFFTLPMIYLAYEKYGAGFVVKWQLWILLIASVIPLVWWRWWIGHFPEGIPVSDWLFNEGNIRFKGAFFYWLFADRVGRLILGYWGLAIFVLGIIAKSKEISHRSYIFFLSFGASSLLYLAVIARGNVQHDYYQIVIMPSIAIFLALGGDFLLSVSKEYFHKKVSICMLFVCIIAMIGFSWYSVRDFFNINNGSIVTAGKAVDALTPKDAKVIAIYDGDTSFLYQTNRKGWASFEKPLPDMIKMGAHYLILVNPTENDHKGFGKTYKVVAVTPQYMILDLTHTL